MMKKEPMEYVYDSSISSVESSSFLSSLLAHLCLGPFRIVGRVFSNLCLVQIEDRAAVFRTAAIFNISMTVAALISFIISNKRSLAFLFGMAASLLLFVVITVYLTTKKNSAQDISGVDIDVDTQQIEEMCGEFPNALEQIIQQNNL